MRGPSVLQDRAAEEAAEGVSRRPSCPDVVQEASWQQVQVRALLMGYCCYYDCCELLQLIVFDLCVLR